MHIIEASQLDCWVLCQPLFITLSTLRCARPSLPSLTWWASHYATSEARKLQFHAIWTIQDGNDVFFRYWAVSSATPGITVIPKDCLHYPPALDVVLRYPLPKGAQKNDARSPRGGLQGWEWVWEFSANSKKSDGHAHMSHPVERQGCVPLGTSITTPHNLNFCKLKVSLNPWGLRSYFSSKENRNFANSAPGKAPSKYKLYQPWGITRTANVWY